MSAAAHPAVEYFVLDAATDGEGRRRTLLDAPAVTGIRSWLSGRVIQVLPAAPIRLTWDPATIDAAVSDYEPVGIPLMSDRLLEVIRAAGVEHLQRAPVEIHGEHAHAIDRSFAAVNIVGAPTCVRESRRGTRVRLGEIEPPVYWYEGFEVVVDRAMGMRLFRPAELRSAIVVDGVIRRAIENAGLAVRCIPTSRWCG